uniref:SFRICE_022702 n=1 Tax=Spodoptera frugiperda TaxID=7108 RepID=A0A2H1WHS4_SPOFR
MRIEDEEHRRNRLERQRESRCLTHLRKRKVPAQAYWNKMDVAPVPPELASLSEVEQRLLSRMIPFLKIIKVHNRFSQSWCKGQVVLFAQDVVEVAEQLPLPISVLVESRENLEQQRQFNVNTERIKTALERLLRHNRLYHDVIPNFENVLEYDISQIIHVADIQECANNQVQVDNSEQIHEQRVNTSTFRDINSDVAILHSTFHQGNDRFDVDSRGKQCTAVAAVACTAFAITDANRWTVSDIDYIVIVGDSFYRQCIEARENPDAGELNLEYLAAREILMPHDSTTPVNFIQGTNNLERRIILSTSLLYSIDEDVANLENIVNTKNENQFDDYVRVVDIQRKTAPPINIERERRMEELCWYFLSPDGKNGFGEIRDIAITALDYFQTRIMGKDNRFKRNDYLFIALSES